MYLISFSYCLAEDFCWSKVTRQCRPTPNDIPLLSTVNRINVFMSLTQMSPPPLLLPEGVCVTTVRVLLMLLPPVLPPCSSSSMGARCPSGVGSWVCGGRSRNKSTSTEQMPTKRFSVSHKNILWNRVLTDASQMCSLTDFVYFVMNQVQICSVIRVFFVCEIIERKDSECQ